jgi:hypothetical protein
VRPRRLVLLVDGSASHDLVDREVASWRSWATDTDLVLARIVFGRRAGWVPDEVMLVAGSAVARGVGVVDRPALGEALALADARGADALVVALALDPEPGWESSLDASVRFRACVALSSEPARALGHGYLGAPFRGEHFGLALRWLTRELCDRTFACTCGAWRVYPDDATSPCPECDSPADVPARLRIGERVILMTPGARVYPHHLGRPLDYERPVRVLDDVPRQEGTLDLEGVVATIRVRSPSRVAARARRFRPPPLRAFADRCAACEGPLVLDGGRPPKPPAAGAGSGCATNLPPTHHEAPDPRWFCGPCVHADPRCDFCLVPLGKTPRNVWPDGRKACADCWSTAVTSTGELASLAAMARAWMQKRLKMEMPDCPCSLEHAAAIAKMHGRTFAPLPGFNPRTTGFFRKPVAGNAQRIFLEHGTPRSMAYGVLAHELTHLWQWHNWSHDRAATLVEGLAMWVEYHALLDAGAIFAARHSERYGDAVYGLGFRIALAAEKESGFDAVKTRMHDITSVAIG